VETRSDAEGRAALERARKKLQEARDALWEVKKELLKEGRQGKPAGYIERVDRVDTADRCCLCLDSDLEQDLLNYHLRKPKREFGLPPKVAKEVWGGS